MKQWTRVRHKVLRDKQSKRSVMREEGLHWETLEKMLAYSQPPGYRRKKRRGRKIDPYVGWIEEVLKADRNVPRKQRHTAKRLYQRLAQEEGLPRGLHGGQGGGGRVASEAAGSVRAAGAPPWGGAGGLRSCPGKGGGAIA